MEDADLKAYTVRSHEDVQDHLGEQGQIIEPIFQCLEIGKRRKRNQDERLRRIGQRVRRKGRRPV
jgi:hypothetical protein